MFSKKERYIFLVPGIFFSKHNITISIDIFHFVLLKGGPASFSLLAWLKFIFRNIKFEGHQMSIQVKIHFNIHSPVFVEYYSLPDMRKKGE